MEFLRIIYEQADTLIPAFTFIIWGLFIALITSGAIHHKESDHSALQIFAIWLKRALIIITLVGVPFSFFILYVLAVYFLGFSIAGDYTANIFSTAFSSLKQTWWMVVPLLFIPSFLKVIISKLIIPKISQLKRKWAIKQTNDTASDIRIEAEKLKAKKYNPRDFYSKDKYFYGLNEFSKPVYDKLEKFVKTHEKIIGPTQTGKGVYMGMQIDQLIWLGWGVIFGNRKPDDFIPDIMLQACKLSGREKDFIICDLNKKNSIGYHPLLRGTDREVRSRAMKLFNLQDTGDNADHYKINARIAFDLVFPHWDRTLIHLKELLMYPPITLSKSDSERVLIFGQKVLTAVNEILALEQFNPKNDGLNIEEILVSGKVLLLNTSMDDMAIRAVEECLNYEMLQCVKRTELPKYVKYFIDEAKYAINTTLADSLAVTLSKKFIMALAYQSVSDPENLPDKTLNAKAIRNAVEANTQTTICYSPQDKDTANTMAMLTGTIQKTVTKMEKIELKNGAEQWTGDRTVGQVEEFLINENTLKTMPPMVCALFRPGELAVVLYTCFIPVKEFPIKKGQYFQQLEKNEPSQNNKASNVTDNGNIIDLIGEDPFAEMELPLENPFVEMEQSSIELFSKPKEALPVKSIEQIDMQKIDDAASILLQDLFSESPKKNSNSKKNVVKNPESNKLTSLDDIGGI